MHKRIDDELIAKLEFMSDAAAESDLPGAPSRWRRLLHRLYVRRWLVAVAAGVLVVLELAFSMPVAAPVAGLAVIVLAAALIPREGLVRVTRTSPSVGFDQELAVELAGRLIAGLPEPAIVLSASGAVLAFNRKAEEAYEGVKPDRHISAVIRHPNVLDAVAQCGPKAPTQTVTYNERVPVARRVAATVSWCSGNDSRPHASAPSILLFLKDLTEQERLDEMRRDFIANASHELKTPLASLIGFIETLQGSARDDAVARDRFLRIMLQQAERMSRLIDNLLSLSRVEMRAHLRPQSPVEIGEVVRHAAQSLEPLARQSQISVLIAPLEAEAFVLGDRDELIQLFQNLIHNAVKYGEPGGEVRVSMRRESTPGGARLAIAVADTGPGIAPRHLPRLTERFYRAGEGAAAQKSGTGLGLAIVEQVVNRHRGELQIASEVGKGSTFTVLLKETEVTSTEPPGQLHSASPAKFY